MDPELKHDAEEVFRGLGLTTPQAITLFYKQVELERGLPFAVRLPNDETMEALEFKVQSIRTQADRPK